jgi:hypothetical protein
MRLASRVRWTGWGWQGQERGWDVYEIFQDKEQDGTGMRLVKMSDKMGED